MREGERGELMVADWSKCFADVVAKCAPVKSFPLRRNSLRQHPTPQGEYNLQVIHLLLFNKKNHHGHVSSPRSKAITGKAGPWRRPLAGRYLTRLRLKVGRLDFKSSAANVKAWRASVVDCPLPSTKSCWNEDSRYQPGIQTRRFSIVLKGATKVLK